MDTATNTKNDAVTRYLKGIAGDDYLVRLDWEQWLDIEPPYPEVGFKVQEVTARFSRNGYEWDIHGRLYIPEKDVDPSIAITVTHGGAGSERIMDETPDGRPGVSPRLAAQGFRVLAMTYPGHYPPGGTWTESVEERMPHYLFDRKLPMDEILDRNLKCTFNVICQGFAALIDKNLAGRKILGWGHSTSGPMQAHMHRFVKKAEYVGLLGFGTGGPDGWRKEWRELDWRREGQGVRHRSHLAPKPEVLQSGGLRGPRGPVPVGRHRPIPGLGRKGALPNEDLAV